MNIYFSASITGGRKFLPVYKKIVQYLKDEQHHVYTEHIIVDNIFEYEEKLNARDIFCRDIEWVEACDALIAEISNPSTGVGYEICHALEHQKPTLCLYQSGIMVSKMITGNTASCLTVGEYNSDEENYRRKMRSVIPYKKKVF